jgi:hypothetical protein
MVVLVCYSGHPSGGGNVADCRYAAQTARAELAKGRAMRAKPV